jgi:hypothetical protein
MTLIVWASWRLVQTGRGKPNNIAMGLTIGISAVLFGLSHVPLAINSITLLSTAVIVEIVAGNMIFGVMAGHLFWCYGLESAIIAHIFSHIGSCLILG